ncbi:MAG: hypothetical protein ACYSTG_02020 [Planctomycetota bacterium]|jgi:hypothetical protein
MFKDRLVVWVLEYVFGGLLVVVPMTGLVVWRPAWMDAYLCTVQLFIACLGVVLISCASSMRQRMLLAKRIDALAEEMRRLCQPSQKSDATKSVPE